MADGYAAKPKIEINGQALRSDIEVQLDHVLVDDHLHLPDTFTVCFRDAARDVLDNAGIKIGAPVRILAARVGKEAAETLMVGEVTALEADYSRRGSFITVRGYDQSHRLQRERSTETYLDVTDTDIVTKVASRSKVPIGRLDESKRRHAHVSQANLTDWEFLKDLAREIGFEVAVVEGKLEFRRPPEAAEAPDAGDLSATDRLQLVLGRNLDEFRPRLTAAEQVQAVQVRSWDPDRKEVVIGNAPSKTTSASLALEPADLAEIFGSQNYVSVDRPTVKDQREADAVAVAIAESIGSAFAEAEGIASGDPMLKAGATVSVGLTDRNFEGRYAITASRHVFDEGGYKTHFVVSGRHERSLLGLTSMGGANGSLGVGPPIHGLVIAQVTAVDDPEEQGRVKLKFPWLSETYESDWVRVAQPGAGPRRGFVLIPEVNDEVLVAFERGDVRRPYVIGSLYNGVDKPELGDGLIDSHSGEVRRRGFVSKLGHRLVFLDDEAQSGICLISASDNLKIALKDTGTTVRITSTGRVEIEADGDISLSAQGTLKLSGSQGVTMESQGVVTVKGSQVRLN